MAREAGHDLPTAEILRVDLGHHPHHLARHLLAGIGVPRVVGPVVGRRRVAVLTRKAQGGGKHAHRAHELVDRNAAESRDVLKDVLGQRLVLRHVLRRCRLPTHQRHAQQPHGRRTDRAKDHLPRSELHAVSDGISVSRTCCTGSRMAPATAWTPAHEAGRGRLGGGGHRGDLPLPYAARPVTGAGRQEAASCALSAHYPFATVFRRRSTAHSSALAPAEPCIRPAASSCLPDPQRSCRYSWHPARP